MHAELRAHLVKLLAWEDAHVGFDRAVKGVGARQRGVVPPGGEHSIWQLVEHIRLAQDDILEFCVSSKYKEKKWPDEYWPKRPSPRDAAAWKAALTGVRAGCRGLQKLAADTRVDLFAQIPHGTGQTYLREILLVADHTSYHVGQIVAVRRALGIWGEK